MTNLAGTKSTPSALPAVPERYPGGDVEIAVKNSSPGSATITTVKLLCIHIHLGPEVSHTPVDSSWRKDLSGLTLAVHKSDNLSKPFA